MSPCILSENRSWFPPLEAASAEGLLAMGGDLSPERLLAAYARGIFPWYSEDTPILWWSPDPRTILPLDAVHVPRRLERRLRNRDFSFTMDTVFSQVIDECAASSRPGQRGTWLVGDMICAYTWLHHLGYAHSVEVWKDGVLVGGLYGVALGRAFFGESMFYRVPDASKAALVWLARRLRKWGFTLCDCQQHTVHMARFGAVDVPRKEFARLLEQALSPWPGRGIPGPGKTDHSSSLTRGSWASRS